MKLAIEASLKCSPINTEKEAEQVDAVFDLSDIEFSQERVTPQVQVMNSKARDGAVVTEIVPNFSQEDSFSEDMFADDVFEEVPKVVVAGVRSRREVQSKSSEESLNLLEEQQPSSSRQGS